MSFSTVCDVIAVAAAFVDGFAWLRRSALCLLVFVNVTFQMAYFFDSTAFARMRSKNGWSLVVFHVGNVVVHWAPLVCYARAGRDFVDSVALQDVALAMAIYAAWTLYARDPGSYFEFTRVYVRMPPGTYEKCAATGMAAMAGVAMLR